jgi:DNA-binding NtrC family response regulator
MTLAENRPRILIIDDEPTVCHSLSLLLKDLYQVDTVSSGDAALEVLEKRELPDVVLLDVMMPDMDGLSLLKKVRELDSKIPVIMLTGAGNVKSAVDAMKNGAIDYLSKPYDVTELKDSIRVSLEGKCVEEPVLVQARSAQCAADFGPMVGKSHAMAQVFAQIDTIASRDSTVLITGESGTGKELVARQIHERSARARGPFIAINCASIPETLIESELFGHEKGAFTHAVERRLGQFELADGGTLFLDEIGELSPAVQVKLLRFLQEQEFYRVGRSKPIRVNVRIVTATNKDLEVLIKQGSFRQDLFYRIHVIHVTLPPLRERHDDIEFLCENFVQRLSAHYGGRVLSFSKEAMAVMMSYHWPGNVRELGNVVESLMALCPRDCVEENDLPRKVRERLSSDTVVPQSFASGLAFEDAERMFETEMIVKALRKANFVQTRAAEMLGISRRILKYKMDKLCINERGEVVRDQDS